MRYSRETRERARQLYLSGKYTRAQQIADACGIKNEATIYAWSKRFKWPEQALALEKKKSENLLKPKPPKKQLDSGIESPPPPPPSPPPPPGDQPPVQPPAPPGGKPVPDQPSRQRTDAEIMQHSWRTVMAQALAILNKNGRDRNNRLVPIRALELQAVASVLERAQRALTDPTTNQIESGSRVMYVNLRQSVREAYRVARGEGLAVDAIEKTTEITAAAANGNGNGNGDTLAKLAKLDAFLEQKKKASEFPHKKDGNGAK